MFIFVKRFFKIVFIDQVLTTYLQYIELIYIFCRPLQSLCSGQLIKVGVQIFYIKEDLSPYMFRLDWERIGSSKT